MDPLNILEVVVTIITAVIALIIGLRVLSLNKTDILNRWFGLYFISSSLGFLFFAIYHLILNNAGIVIPLMITAQIFFNLNAISLTMTIFALEEHSKTVMSWKYLGVMLIVFFLMSAGYLLFPPHLDMDDYALGIVDTHTPPGLLVFVNAIRIFLAVFAVYKYSAITKKLEGETKKRMTWFSMGVIIIIVGLFINLAGGLFESIVVEIVALITIDIGAFLVLKGFLI